MTPRTTKRKIVWALGAMAIGLVAAAVLNRGGVWAFRTLAAPRALESRAASTGVGQTKTQTAGVFADWVALGLGELGRVPERLAAAVAGRAILVDLDAMTLTLSETGAAPRTFKILSKGRPGSPWETPAGDYRIGAREVNHFSSIGGVWMPYSLQFFGNFFIHGWPRYPNDAPVGEGFSGGCIRLTTEDAKQVFEFAAAGTPVRIQTKTVPSAPAAAGVYRFNRALAPPALSAAAYLVADLSSGEILLARNQDQILPIASLTKLLTALTSLEVINQFTPTRVSARAVATTGESGGLVAGELLPVQDLLHPLLLESSNDAAEVLAEHYGRDEFIARLNEKAAAIGLADTRLADSSGISAENVSSPNDLFRLLRYLFTGKQYLLALTKEKAYAAAGHQWANNNPLVNDERFVGGKTGKTNAAGETFAGIFNLPISAAARRNVGVILLASANRERDVEEILTYLGRAVTFGPENNLAAVATPVAAAKSGELSLAFVGDIMLDRSVALRVDRAGGDFHPWFDGVRELAEADILFGNLEGPVSDQGNDLGHLYSFRFRPTTLAALRDAGFDVLQVANNHSGDWGRAAFDDTLARLNAAGFVAPGGGADRAAAGLVKILNRGGVRVGFLAASDVGSGELAATESESGIILAGDPEWPELISRAAREVDLLVVGYHFGAEYQTEPNARQRELARLAIDHGAKLVIGTHPHVVQPVERYRDGVIAYSLGNFIFDQFFSTATMRGLALTVIWRDGAIAEVTERPVVLDENFKPRL